MKMFGPLIPSSCCNHYPSTECGCACHNLAENKSVPNCNSTLVQASKELLAANERVVALTEVLKQAREALKVQRDALCWCLECKSHSELKQKALREISKALGE